MSDRGSCFSAATAAVDRTTAAVEHLLSPHTYKLLAPNNYEGGVLHIRILFAAVGRLKELDDSEAFAIDFAKFKDVVRTSGIEAACPDFVVAREAGKMVANLNRMPVMVVDGVAIGQLPVIYIIYMRGPGEGVVGVSQSPGSEPLGSPNILYIYICIWYHYMYIYIICIIF